MKIIFIEEHTERSLANNLVQSSVNESNGGERVLYISLYNNANLVQSYLQEKLGKKDITSSFTIKWFPNRIGVEELFEYLNLNSDTHEVITIDDLDIIRHTGGYYGLTLIYAAIKKWASSHNKTLITGRVIRN